MSTFASGKLIGRPPGRPNFWTMMEVNSPDECWPCKTTSVMRYPMISHQGVMVSGHRVAFYLTEGYWPEVVRHTCIGNTRCWNPFHLLAGSPDENVQDCIEQGRHTKGEMVGNHKLFESDVLDIRYRAVKGIAGVKGSGNFKILATEYSVTPELIQQIVARKIWKHI